MLVTEQVASLWLGVWKRVCAVRAAGRREEGKPQLDAGRRKVKQATEEGKKRKKFEREGNERGVDLLRGGEDPLANLAAAADK